MLSENTIVLVTVLLNGIFLVHSIRPVCFNCHCSTYDMDQTIRCRDAELNKSKAYFSILTKNVTVVEGSDALLAVQLKEPHGDYCWCTDALLEWNGLYPNSSGHMLIVLMENTTRIETGHFWAVILVNKKFYFSEPVYLNVTGPPVIIIPTLPDLHADPKMSALIVGILIILIMILGLFIYCWKMHKKRRIDRIKVANFQRMQTLDSSDVRIPLNWPLQDPSFFIHESDTEVVYGPDPRPQSEEAGNSSSLNNSDEEGTNKSVGDQDSTSLISSDDDHGTPTKQTSDKEKKNSGTSKRNTPKTSPTAIRITRPSLSAPQSPHPHSMLGIAPITDDRFTTERSWYRSLNTEICSGPLLQDPEREQRREEKKRLKSLAKASCENIASGILRSGDIGSGFMGSSSSKAQPAHQLRNVYSNITKDFQYGRSLPTPQPAGARPTVMTLFPISTSSRSHMRATATIHSTNPNKHRPIQTFFKDVDTLKSARSVQFSDTTSPTRSFSTNNISSSTKANKKSNLKNKNKICGLDQRVSQLRMVCDPDGRDVEVDAPLNENEVQNAKSSLGSSDSGHESESSGEKKLGVPQLMLVPASPTISPPQNRFTVRNVSSTEISQPTNGETNGLWDFSSNTNLTLSSSDTLHREMNRQKRNTMDLLTVPGFEYNQNLEGYWTN